MKLPKPCDIIIIIFPHCAMGRIWQVVLGLRRCLFPSGVQNKPSLETLLGYPLRTCLIHVHFLRVKLTMMSSCLQMLRTNLPFPVHLVSLTPKISTLFCFISLATCAAFPHSNIIMVLTFQHPILVMNLGPRREGFGLQSVILPSEEWSSFWRPVVLHCKFPVSVSVVVH